MSRVQLCATTRSTTAGSKTVGLPLRRRPQPAPRRSLATPRPRLRGSALGRHGTAAGRGPRSSGPPRAARPRSGLAQRGRALQCCRHGSAGGVVRWRSGLEQRRRTRRPCSPRPLSTTEKLLRQGNPLLEPRLETPNRLHSTHLSLDQRCRRPPREPPELVKSLSRECQDGATTLVGAAWTTRRSRYFGVAFLQCRTTWSTSANAA